MTPTPNPTPAEAVAAMTDAEVNAQIEQKVFGETVTVMDTLDPESNPMPTLYWVAGNPPREPRPFTSPDAPHALRMELAEAVIKAGRVIPFIKELSKLDCVGPLPYWRDSIHGAFKGEAHTGAYGLFMGLTLEPRTIARAALAALLAKGATTDGK